MNNNSIIPYYSPISAKGGRRKTRKNRKTRRRNRRTIRTK